jgi:8-oxo-dGTP pyrophosphatase MutT (NUDIX family)
MVEARAQGVGLSDDHVRAAGGVVLRPGGDGFDVLLVHRAAYDDWSLPKGKCNLGESDEDCALREVEEETGLRCVLEHELPSTSYRDAKGRPKVVRYWAMRPVGGEARPQAEVDDVRWLPLEKAQDELTWERDRTVLEAV